MILDLLRPARCRRCGADVAAVRWDVHLDVASDALLAPRTLTLLDAAAAVTGGHRVWRVEWSPSGVRAGRYHWAVRDSAPFGVEAYTVEHLCGVPWATTAAWWARLAGTATVRPDVPAWG